MENSQEDMFMGLRPSDINMWRFLLKEKDEINEL